MRRHCLLETLQVIRSRDEYVRRATLSRAIQEERRASHRHQLACSEAERRAEGCEEARQQASALLRTGHCTASQGQQWTDWQRCARDGLQRANAAAGLSLKELRAKRTETRCEQRALARCSVALDQVRRRLAQRALQHAMQRDNQEHEALEDLSLHRRLSRIRPHHPSRP